MTRNQRERLQMVALQQFSIALRQAVQLVDLPEPFAKRRLIPLWSNALHQVLIEVGACHCTTGKDHCFQRWSEVEQLEQFGQGHSLGFDMFWLAFKEGCVVAQLALTPSGQHANTQ